MRATNLKTTGLWFSASLALTIAACGCHKRPENMANIYGYPKTQPLTDADKSPAITNDLAGEKPLEVSVPDPTLRETWIRDRKAFEKDTVYFDFDSSVVKTGEKSKVANVASYLKSNPGKAVEIEGHCDERGTEEYNRSLGERRALAVREALIRAGIASDRVDTLSWGEDKPLAEGHNEAAWKQNRRA